jgi:hypothetical protein
MDGNSRIVAGIALLLLGALTVAVEMLSIVEVAVAVALPVAVLLIASGTVLLGTSEVRSGRLPV